MIGSRTCCIVPHCRRTTAHVPGYAEWVCQRHWSAVPKPMKARLRTAKRLFERRRRDWIRQPTDRNRSRAIAAGQLADAIWERCKEAAVARGIGL